MEETYHYFQSFVHKLYENEKQFSDEVYLRQPVNGIWHEYTWRQVMDRARRLVSFFHSQGLEKGDRVSIFSKNCAEWFITDFATAMAGLVNVPLYASQQHETINFILTETDVKIIFLGKIENWPLQEQGIPKKIIRVNFPYDSTIKADFQWNTIIQSHSPSLDNVTPIPEDIFTIVYTSGTDGQPKGVVLTYQNQSSVSHSLDQLYRERFFIKPKVKYVSYLPLAHIYERIAEIQSCYVLHEVSFIESLDTFGVTLQSVAPTVFTGVPRIWKVFKEKILEKISQQKLDLFLKIPLISMFIKYKIKKSLGLQHAICVCGSAPLTPSVILWFEKIDIVIYEGYGSTENCAASAVNYVGNRKVGTVGKANFGYEYKLGENNELLCRSLANMKGYYGNSEKTKAVLDEAGYYHTGDIGSIDEEGYITIHSRESEIFKTDKAEFIIPMPIENRLHEISQLSQLCLIGEELRQPVLITHLTPQAKAKPKAIIRQQIFEALQKINQDLVKWERISHIIITQDDWTINNDLLTPTFKVKRKMISKKFHPLAEKLQDQDDGVYWEEELS